MPKYRLTQGTHYENETKYIAGQIVESKRDLTLFNHPGSVRFEKVGEDAKDNPIPQAPTTKQSGAHETLLSMSVEELKQMAAEEEIDLGKAKTKSEIVDAISKAYGTA